MIGVATRSQVPTEGRVDQWLAWVAWQGSWTTEDVVSCKGVLLAVGVLRVGT